MDEIMSILEQLWRSLPDWAHDIGLVILGATGATLLALYKDALAGLLRRSWEFLQTLGSIRWKDRAFERAYIDWVIAKHKDLKLVGVQAHAKLPLEDVFVSLRMKVDRTLYPSLIPQVTEDFERENHISTSDRTLSIGELMRAAQKTVILGDPGSGKTTLLQYIALTFARERAGERKFRRRGIVKQRLNVRRWRLPVLVPLRAVSSSGKFENWPQLLQISPYLQYPQGYFERQLERGRCVLLLDGLDETKTAEDQRSIGKAISDLASPPYSGNQMIVTCRQAGWRDFMPSEFARVEVRDFSAEETDSFIHYWYDAVERSMTVGDEAELERKLRQERALERATDLISVLARNPRVRRLARNPLLLSIIAIVHRTRVVLPRQRAKLYRECVELLLEQWDVARGIQIDDTGLSLDQKMSIMRDIAYALQESGRPQATRKQLERIIQAQLALMGKVSADVSRLLNLLEERSGLIAERSIDALSFAHLTFQEYLAAQAIAGDSARVAGLLSPSRLFDPKWLEVALLYVGVVEDATEFIQAVYSPEDEDIFRTRLRLAVRCLNDAVKVDPTLRMRLVQELASASSTAEFDLLKKEVAEVARAIDSEELVEAFRRSAGVGRETEVVAFADGDRQWQDNTLLVQLKNTDPKIRIRAMERLGNVLSDPTSANALVAALSDQDFDVKSKAIAIVAREHQVNERIIDTVIGLAGDNEWRIRQRAMRALGSIGYLSIEASKALLRGLEDQEKLVARSAAAALGSLGQNTDEAREGLQRATSSPDDSLRIESARALLRIGQKDKAVFDVLRRYLQHPNWAYRMAVVEILSHEEVAMEDSSLVDSTVMTLKDTAWQVRVYALDCITRWHHAGPQAIDLVVDCLSDENKGVRERAILTLIGLGLDTARLSAQLQRMLLDEDDSVRARAVEAIGNLTSDRVEWMRTLVELAQREESPLVRSAFARIMGKWRILESEVVDTLMSMLDDANSIPGQHKLVKDIAYEALYELSSQTGIWIHGRLPNANEEA